MRITAIPGAVPHPLNLPKGCKFAPRCKYCQQRCLEEEPELVNVSDKQHYSSRASAMYTNENNLRPSVYYQYTSSDHTRAKVGVFVYGIDADFTKFGYYGAQPTIKNITVFELLADVLDHPIEYGQRAA